MINKMIKTVFWNNKLTIRQNSELRGTTYKAAWDFKNKHRLKYKKDKLGTPIKPLWKVK